MSVKRGPSDEAQANDLLARVLATGDFDAAEGLLKQIFRGYPVERLRQVLQSADPVVVAAGSFVASELGQAASPLIAEFERLLRSPSIPVRYDALDCVLVCAGTNDGCTIARALTLLDDPDTVIRRKATKFLSRASQEQLAAAVPFLEQQTLVEQIRWLLDSGADHQQIVTRLASKNSWARRAAVAAAARLPDDSRESQTRGEVRDPDALDLAARGDDEIAQFAAEVLADRKALKR